MVEVYDIKIKQLIYIAGSRHELSKISKNRFIDMYLSGRLYLGQFIFSNNLLIFFYFFIKNKKSTRRAREGDYIVNLMSPDSLSTYVDEVRKK